MAEAIEHELSTLGTAPIDEANPAGVSASEEPDYEELIAEVGKLESLKGEQVDWRQVVRLSSRILQSKSKDLKVAVYLCQGLIQTEGYKGLAVGLQIISDMVDNHWDAMFPPVKRLRARKGVMEWLSDKAVLFINSHAPTASDGEAVVHAAKLGRGLDSTLAEKMGDEAPSITEMTRPLRQFAEGFKHDLAKAAAAAPAAEPAAPPVVQDAPPPAPVPPPAQAATPVSADSTPAAAQPASEPVVEHELLTLGATPVDEANPAGVSASEEPEYEELMAEVGKLESLKGEQVDWRQVVRLASGILQRKSKDLKVAVYLCQGLIQTEGYKGLAVGLRIISDMVDNHWEAMFPPVKRLRARKGVMEWLSDKAVLYINANAPTANDGDAVLVAAKVGRGLDSTLGEKMGDEAPSITELTRPLRQFADAAKFEREKKAKEAAAGPSTAAEQPTTTAPSREAEPSRAAPPPPPPVTRTPPTSTASKTPAAEPVEVGDIQSDAEARKALRQLQDGVRKIATFLVKAKPSDPKAYRLGRTAVWMTIDQVPPHKEGVTQIPAPPADRRKHFAGLFEQAQYSTLVPDLEQLVARSAFWLDGHRLLANSLKSMGAEFAAAREIVITELRSFLARLPGLEDLKFADGTPFADEATRMWLDSEVKAAGGGGGEGAGPAPKAAPAGATPWTDALNAARGLAAAGDLQKAVRGFHTGIAQAGNLREQFNWRSALCELLIQSGSLGAAIQMLEEMTNRIEQLHLDQWEPEFATHVYRKLFDAYQKLAAKKKGDASLAAKMESAYSRLCWLDPMTAITLKGD